MKKKKLVFVHFNRFLDKFDWLRYELDYLSEKYDVEVQKLMNITHPKLKIKKLHNYKHSLNIKSFKSFIEWNDYLKREKENTFFIFQSFPYNLRALKAYYSVQSKKFKTAIIFPNSLPNFKNHDIKEKFFAKYFHKFLSLIFRPYQAFGIIQKKIISIIFWSFAKKLEPNFYLVGGNNPNKFNLKKTIKINSWDYSNSLRNKKNIFKNKNYILYISDGESRYQSDSIFYNTKRVENTESYLKKINLFFNSVEKKFKKKIIIASHPRGNPNLTFDNRLGKRRIFYGKTCELAKNAKFVISLTSTALNYAILNKKPIMIIYSQSEQKKNISWIKYSSFYSSLLNCSKINIDDYKNLEKINLKKVDLKSYKNFKKNYIYSRYLTPNFKILGRMLERK